MQTNDIIDITPTAERGLATTTAIIDGAFEIVPSIEPSWDMARKWAETAKRLQRGVFWSKAMAGIQLIGLREQHGTNQGKRRDLGTSPSSLEKLDWPDLVKREMGISDETARLWMRYGEQVIPALKQFPDLAQLADKPVSRWSHDEVTLVGEALEKIGDRKEQKDFMAALGVLQTADQNARQPPNNKCLQEWLQKVHPKLAGTTWGHLPKGIRHEFDVAVKKGQAQRHLVNAVTKSDDEVAEAVALWSGITGEVSIPGNQEKLALLPDAELERVLGAFVDVNNIIRDLQKARPGKK